MSSQFVAKPEPEKSADSLAGEVFAVEIKDNIAHLRLKRPAALNSMIPAFWRDLPRLVRHIDSNALARVIVLSGEGKHFCAGMDLSVFTTSSIPEGTEISRARAALYKNVLKLQDALSTLEKARMPVLAAIQGACVGGAVDLVSACDVRYATQNAFFCIHEINIGMTADVGTFPRLPHLMPQGLVRELAYTGRRLYAEEAQQAGFITRLFDTPEAMQAGVMEIAGEIAARSPLAVWGSKHMINEGRGRTIEEGMERIALWQSGMFHPADLKEGLQAQQEKRAARYRDLLPVPDEESVL